MAYTAVPTRDEPRESALSSYRYDALDELLYDWFQREQNYAPVVGYSRVDPACAHAVTSRQWDSIDDVLDSRVEAYVMPLISAAMDELPGDYRLAILIEQRNRMGPAVYRNPRAGDRQPEVYAEAKKAIAPILSRKGVEY